MTGERFRRVDAGQLRGEACGIYRVPAPPEEAEGGQLLRFQPGAHRLPGHRATEEARFLVFVVNQVVRRFHSPSLQIAKIFEAPLSQATAMLPPLGVTGRPVPVSISAIN